MLHRLLHGPRAFPTERTLNFLAVFLLVATVVLSLRSAAGNNSWYVAWPGLLLGGVLMQLRLWPWSR